MYQRLPRLFAGLLLLMSVLPAFAQFQRYYPSGIAYDGIQTSDGGYAIFGESNYFGLGRTFYLVRTDPFGDTIYTRSYAPVTANSWGKSIRETADGGLIMFGESAVGNATNQSLVKTDAAGNIAWSRNYVGLGTAQARAVRQTYDHGYVMLGSTVTTIPASALMVRTDSLGDTLWTRKFPLANGTHLARSIEPLADKGFILGGTLVPTQTTQRGKFTLSRLDSLGQVLWSFIYFENDTLKNYELSAAIPTSDGGFAAIGVYQDATTAWNQGFMLKTDGTGVVQWVKYEQAFQANIGFSSIVEVPSGGYTLFGINTNPLIGSNLLRINASGQTLWQQTIFRNNGTYGINSRQVGLTTNGGYYAIGDFMILDNYVLTVTDSLGNFITNAINGSFFEDLNQNCAKDLGEPDFDTYPFVAVATRVGTTDSYYGKVDSSGNYHIDVPGGTYQVTHNTQHPYLAFPCPVAPAVTLNQTGQTAVVNLPVQTTIACPLNFVDISSQRMRIGDTARVEVLACNYGTAPSFPTTVTVTLDSFLTYGSATAPLISQVGQVLTFDLDTLQAGACTHFSIRAFLDSTVVPGQTHCLEAHIFPDSVCSGPGALWSGPVINARAICMGDTIRFDLRNEGRHMLTPQHFVIYIDDVIFRSGNFLLDSGNVVSVVEPAQPGATYRIEAQQSSGFPPILGDSAVVAFTEGCNPFMNGTFNLGWITAYYNGNVSPFASISCVQNTTSLDPNDKQAQPAGYASSRYIYENTPLQYQIRFQNTGNDTALRVVVVDTLSQFLDPATVVPGTASHPYSWSMTSGGTLRFVFKPIALVDSLTNEAESQGFVRFSVAQRAGNLPGTEIRNRASIYFDYNAPVLTNTTLHTVGKDFVTRIVTHNQGLQPAGIGVRISPNPVVRSAWVSLSEPPLPGTEFRLMNILGQTVYSLEVTESYFEITPKSLPRGIYPYQLLQKGEIIAVGKLGISQQ